MSQRKEPYVVEESPGTKYYCACQRSSDLPYCDGTHEGTGIQPYTVEIERPTTVAICGCGRSSKKPYCDGTHETL